MNRQDSGRHEPSRASHLKRHWCHCGGLFYHETAVLHPAAEIGKGVKIWHFCHIMGTARIGRGTVIGQNGFVAGVIGERCRIQNNVSIYEGVTLEDGVFVGPSAVFTNVKYPKAHVQQRPFQKTRVKSGAVIGANATIVCGVTIGKDAMVGAGAVVTKDVPDEALVVGVPAKIVEGRSDRADQTDQ